MGLGVLCDLKGTFSKSRLQTLSLSKSLSGQSGLQAPVSVSLTEATPVSPHLSWGEAAAVGLLCFHSGEGLSSGWATTHCLGLLS